MKSIDLEELRRLYLAGMSELDVSKLFGVTRPRIRNCLLKLGIKPRGRSAAALNRQRQLSPQQRLALAERAHAAVRGIPKSEEHLCKIALARQKRPIQVGPSERTIQKWLEALGAETVPQKAIGRYNIDVALTESRIAVEIFGGWWHAAGRHAIRFRPRIEYLADRGWHTVIVWITTRHRLAYPVAENIFALHQAVCEGESIGRQEHVMRGDGYIAPIGKAKAHNGSIVTGFNPGNSNRGDDGRFR